MLFFMMFIGAVVIGVASWLSRRKVPPPRIKPLRPAAAPVAPAPVAAPAQTPRTQGPSVVFSGSQLVVDLPASAPLPPPTGNAPFDAVRRQMALNQWDEARRQLQQVAYGMVDAPPHEKAAFTELMKDFAARDPLFSGVLRVVMPLVREQPGLLQSGIYKHLPGIGPEEARYALYFGEQLGLLRRVKKGNSYRLYAPGAVIDVDATTKPKARKLKQKANEQKTENTMMDRFELQRQLVAQDLGVNLETTRPVSLSIDDVTAALWPLNEQFREHLAQIQSLTYDATFEGAADSAVERMVMFGADWSAEPPGVWRVLLERHMQVLQLLALKAAEAGSWSAPFMSVPEPAAPALRSKLAIVFLLHSTPLPFPIVERSGAELPGGAAPSSLTRH